MPRILIVEDEAALTLMLRYNLEAARYAVDTATRGDEAEVKLRESPPDLLILDWMLPGVSGIEICRRLRARAQTRHMPIIMLTARGEESERIRGLATGATRDCTQGGAHSPESPRRNRGPRTDKPASGT